MARDRRLSTREADELLKSVLLFSRTVGEVLEKRAVERGGRRLSHSQVQILRLLDRGEIRRSTHIARFLGTSKPAVTQMVDALAAEGLLSRARDRHDRRNILLSLRPRGRQCLRNVQDEQRQIIRSAVRHSGEGDVAAWTRALRDLTRALAAADRAFGRFCLQCGAYADGSCVLVGGGASCPLAAQGRRRRAGAVNR